MKIRLLAMTLAAVAIALVLWLFVTQKQIDEALVTRAESEDVFMQWTRLIEEASLMQLQARLLAQHKPHATLISEVQIVDVRSGQLSPPVDVRLEDGHIAELAKSIPLSTGTRLIDAKGSYLMPGLVDMHVHSLESTSQPLLNILHGVTTVREMDGFPWLLRQREQAESNQLFAPSMIVTGPILNASPMDWYAEVVSTEQEARRSVRAHSEAGYDAIKVHNNLPPELLAAIFDEATRQQLDVVGHIPHDTSVAQAIKLGYRTAEHLKGYLDDRTLTIADDDWRSASLGSAMWNTPTLQAHRAHLRGTQAQQAIADPESVQMSPLDLEQWRIEGEQPIDDATRVRLGARQYADTIFQSLLADGARFLAGTDSGGGYPFMVYGRVLLQELQDFHALGMPTAQVLRTATLEAAIASRREGEFGEIVPGARADLIVLRANPFDNVDALLDPEVVCMRGACLDRVELERIRLGLLDVHTKTQARLDRASISKSEIDDWLVAMTHLHDNGVVFRDNQLASAAALLGKLARPDDALRVRGWLSDPHRWTSP